jgi:hypothetical protein
MKEENKKKRRRERKKEGKCKKGVGEKKVGKN